MSSAFGMDLLTSARRASDDGNRIGGPPRPGYEQRLEEQSRESGAVGVQTKCSVTVDVLADVAREHRDEEQTGGEAEQLSPAAHDDEHSAERYLDDTGPDHDDVLVDADPVRHLRVEVGTGEREVADAGEDERAAEDDPGGGADVV